MQISFSCTFTDSSFLRPHEPVVTNVKRAPRRGSGTRKNATLTSQLNARIENHEESLQSKFST